MNYIPVKELTNIALVELITSAKDTDSVMRRSYTMALEREAINRAATAKKQAQHKAKINSALDVLHGVA